MIIVLHCAYSGGFDVLKPARRHYTAQTSPGIRLQICFQLTPTIAKPSEAHIHVSSFTIKSLGILDINV